MIAAGTLRHAVTFEERVETPMPSGETGIAWVLFANAQVNIRPVSAKELMEHGQIAHQVTHVITMRYLDGVRKDHRILYGDRVFQIAGIVNVEERNRVLQLNCYETDSDTE